MNEHDSIAEELIARLELLPHPEGGHYRETYRSQQRVLRTGSDLGRSAATAIYYLLRQGERSTWHRIQSDEMWHFYAGEPLHIHVLEHGRELYTLTLGNPLTQDGAMFQALVPAGAWFAAQCAGSGAYALVGCTVAPGFEFQEFEIADKDFLLKTWPQHAQVIERLA
ncbi:hypothetical protein hmeg3_13570 [Herbaspirillum sp. meg3]|uniref:cupin domain-containing protein n=1 Tax=Herbaspirillum sp. meg3 TaxID=2025949 RepID=UPI000B98F76E|nr:cupin domain-containing protein [Herbaspirillum sp. meg3]ASU41436.1 hypothetical protein hmeg3_13570 [Herbaspirillum sp. meg3]